MPDIIAGGQEGVKRWENEKCVSCRVGDDACPLVAVLLANKIETYAGIHVFSCALYYGDVSSPFFIETEAERRKADFDTQMERINA